MLNFPEPLAVRSRTFGSVLKEVEAEEEWPQLVEIE